MTRELKLAEVGYPGADMTPSPEYYDVPNRNNEVLWEGEECETVN